MSPERLPRVAITMGDPAGVGPEIIIKAMRHSEVFSLCTPILLGDAGVFHRISLECGVRVEPKIIQHAHEAEPGRLNLISLSNIELDSFRPGEVKTDLGLISTFYIVKAVDLALTHQVDALVNAPINRASLQKAGYNYSSHSQMLRAFTGETFTCSMLVGERMRITRVTSHAPLGVVPGLLCVDRVLNSLRQTSLSLDDHFGVEKPRLGVCALNPHAGEGGLFGDEDSRILLPAVEAARAEGVIATDPLPADVVFARYMGGDYDAVVCMYHDQAHIAYRLVEKRHGVNLTLGLPIIRTSPDHGAAYDIAGKGYASESGMVGALSLAARLAVNRQRRRTMQAGSPH